MQVKKLWEFITEIENDAIEAYNVRDEYDPVRDQEQAIVDVIWLIKQEMRKNYKCLRSK